MNAFRWTAEFLLACLILFVLPWFLLAVFG